MSLSLLPTSETDLSFLPVCCASLRRSLRSVSCSISYGAYSPRGSVLARGKARGTVFTRSIDHTHHAKSDDSLLHRLTIAALLLKVSAQTLCLVLGTPPADHFCLTMVFMFNSQPLTIISALQLLKYRGDPFSSFGAGSKWMTQCLVFQAPIASRYYTRGVWFYCSTVYQPTYSQLHLSIADWHGRATYGGGGGIGGYQSLGDNMDDERDAEEISIPRHHSQSGQRFGRNRNSQHSGSFTTSSRSTSVKSSRTGSGHNVEMGTNSNTGHQGNPHGSPASAGTASLGGGAASKDDRRDRVGQNVSDDEEDTGSRETPANSTTENSRAGYQSF